MVNLGLLLWFLSSWLGVAESETHVQVDLVLRADGGNVSAAVIDTVAESIGGLGVRVLRYGDCLLGAQFLEEAYRDTSPFTAFNVMAFGMNRVSKQQKGQEKRMLQLGLGVGSVPMFAKTKSGYTQVDAVENSTVVKMFAEKYFSYAAGRVFLDEAYRFLFDPENLPPPNAKYDFVAQDLYMGWNPTHMLNKRVFQQVDTHWLHDTQGVYLVNFIGFHKGQYRAFSESLVNTLRDVFPHVHCFRDSPINFREHAPMNIMCFASRVAALVDFLHGNDPDPKLANIDMNLISLDWIRDNFEHWRVLSEEDMRQSKMTHQLIQGDDEDDLAAFRDSFRVASAEMRDLIRPLLPEEMWAPEQAQADGDTCAD